MMKLSNEFKVLVEEFENLLNLIYPEDLKNILLKRTIESIQSIQQLKNTIQSMKINLISHQVA